VSPSGWDSHSGDRLVVTRFTFEQWIDQARVIIPMHGGDLKRKTLRAIINDLRISVEEFVAML